MAKNNTSTCSMRYGDKVYKLEKESELRFELHEKEETSVYLEYHQILQMNTWYRCQIIIVCSNFILNATYLTGKTDAAYISTNTSMVTYLNLHTALEQMRVKSEKERVRGPRVTLYSHYCVDVPLNSLHTFFPVMVVGPPDVGKSSFCRQLLNYAARIGRNPLFVDLDVEHNDVSIPGTVGVLRVMRPADVGEAFESPPLIFHHGHIRPATNLKLYNALVSRVADAVNIKCDAITKANLSGVIVNTGSCEDGPDYNSLTHAAGAFEVMFDIIIVLGQEKLAFKLKRDLPNFVQFVQISKTGGAVEKCQSYREDRIQKTINNYLYRFGTFKIKVKFSEVQLFKIGEPELPNSSLPFGMKVTKDYKKRIISIQPSASLLHHVFSISSADSAEENVVEMNVLGFVVIKRDLLFLSPCEGPLSKSILLESDLRFTK
ncbi:hypothetical protein ACJMK2_020025 [Sinanodonta woodiana]|uniref:Protein CLP1 homolog n=1 Tax=Sinanodonta woodiana TaxID=1069815 RepID=A0ABD3U0A4_SINWO